MAKKEQKEKYKVTVQNHKDVLFERFIFAVSEDDARRLICGEAFPFGIKAVSCETTDRVVDRPWSSSPLTRNF